MSDTWRKVRRALCIGLVMASVIWGLFVVCTRVMRNNNSSEPQARETIGYAIVNGKRYDITFYATNNGHPYVKTVDGMKICGAGITVFIPED